MGVQIESINTVEQLRCDVKAVIKDIAEDLCIKECEIDSKKQDFSGDNFLGEIVRAKIIPTNNNTSIKPINLFIKLAPQSIVTRDSFPIITFFRNEIAFYTKIVPVIKKLQNDHNVLSNERISFPTLYKGILEDFKELIIMRDLSHDGYISHDKKVPLDYEHLVMVVQNLARLHAASFVLKEKDPELFKKCSQLFPNTVNFGVTFERMIALMPEKVQSLIVDQTNRSKLKSFGDTATQNLHNYLNASLTDPYNVICHGDCWNNNMLFKYKEEKLSDVMFIDYQLARVASPVTDIAYLLCFSANLGVIQYRLKDIFKSYYDMLGASLSRMGCSVERCYPKEIFKENIKRCMGFGLTVAMCGIPLTLTDEGQQPSDTDDLVTQLDEGRYGADISEIAAERLNGLVDVYVKMGFI